MAPSWCQSLPSAVCRAKFGKCHAGFLACCVQTSHQDTVSTLQAEMQQAQAAQGGLQEQLACQDATIQEQLQELQQLKETLADLQNQLSECAVMWLQLSL